jgi:molybdopterin adenylyltransferase
VKVAVITVSDRAHDGVYEDLSGPEIEKILRHGLGGDSTIERTIVPDEKDALIQAFDSYIGFDAIITTGGTGIGPRDITPEVSRLWCDKELEGIAEVLRHESYKETPNAMLSRGFSGIKGKTLLVNFPGSQKAVRLCATVLLPALKHAPSMIEGGGH